MRKNHKEIASIEKAQTCHAEDEQEGNKSAWLFALALEVGEGSQSQVQLQVDEHFLKQKRLFSRQLTCRSASNQLFSETENGIF